MTQELRVNVEEYVGSFPKFGRPAIVGCIDFDNMKYARNITNRRVHFDLNLLLDQAKHKPPGIDVKLTRLLRFLQEEEARLNLPYTNNLEASKFFCYRGLLTCIANTPYENREPWKLVALLSDGDIYLCARATEDKIRRRLNITPDEIKFSSWGFKFEQYMLSDTPDTEPNPNVPVDESEECSLVLATHLNYHNLVYGAEVDGIICQSSDESKPPEKKLGSQAVNDYLSTKEFLELKTRRRIEYHQQEANFRRFKTRKWWCQSFLSGVNTLVCGDRDDAGIVHELNTFTMEDLTNMSQRFWNPNVCFNFLDAFLTFVKRCFADEIRRRHNENALHNLRSLPLISIVLEWNPGMPVQMVGHHCNEDDTILPFWFVDRFRKTRNPH